MNTEILNRISSVFEDVFDERIALTENTTADDVEGWDSLAHVRLIVTIEKHFEIRFNSAEITSLKNIGQLANLIESKLKQKPG